MIKAVPLSDGREARFYIDAIGGEEYELSKLVLRRNGKPLGKMYRDEEDNLVPINPKMWYFDRREEEAAVSYYAEKYPDLAELDRAPLLVKGLMREVEEIDHLFGRVYELVAAANQRDPGPYVAVDDDGRIRAIGDSAFDAIDNAEWSGWTGWYSLIRAGEDTLWIAPTNKVRVKV
jgi:hypothetical protein